MSVSRTCGTALQNKCLRRRKDAACHVSTITATVGAGLAPALNENGTRTDATSPMPQSPCRNETTFDEVNSISKKDDVTIIACCPFSIKKPAAMQHLPNR
ncbi:MAG: hypothetical protein LBR08_03175 [Bacteroidales bacterium]|nr:hypothetical protein [Bacteroidales bacterium]